MLVQEGDQAQFTITSSLQANRPQIFLSFPLAIPDGKSKLTTQRILKFQIITLRNEFPIISLL